MPKFTSLDSVITVGTVDLSSEIDTIQIPEERDALETTNFASGKFRTYQPGLGKADVTIGFFQNFDDASVAATLRPLFIADDPVAVTVTPRNTTIAPTNPQFQFDVIVTKYEDLSGQIGQMGKMSLQWPVTGPITVVTSD